MGVSLPWMLKHQSCGPGLQSRKSSEAFGRWKTMPSVELRCFNSC